jgi:hypothetical protein
LAAHGPAVQDHEVTRGDLGNTRTNHLDGTGGLVAEQGSKLVVDFAVAVGQIGGGRCRMRRS